MGNTTLRECCLFREFLLVPDFSNLHISSKLIDYIHNFCQKKIAIEIIKPLCFLYNWVKNVFLTSFINIVWTSLFIRFHFNNNNN